MMVWGPQQGLRSGGGPITGGQAVPQLCWVTRPVGGGVTLQAKASSDGCTLAERGELSAVGTFSHLNAARHGPEPPLPNPPPCPGLWSGLHAPWKWDSVSQARRHFCGVVWARLRGAGARTPWLPRVSLASGVRRPRGGQASPPQRGDFRTWLSPITAAHTCRGQEWGEEEEDVGVWTSQGLRLRARGGDRPGPPARLPPCSFLSAGAPPGAPGVRGRLHTLSREAPREPRGPRSRPVAVTILQTGCSADITAVKYDFYRLPGRFSHFPAAITATCARLFCHVHTCGCAHVCVPACVGVCTRVCAEAWPSPGTPRSDAGLAGMDGPVHGKLLKAGRAVLWAPPLAPGLAEPFLGCPQPPQPGGLPDLWAQALVSRSAAWASLGGGGAPRPPPTCSSSVLVPSPPRPGSAPRTEGCRAMGFRGREDTQPRAAWLKQHPFVLTQEEHWGPVSAGAREPSGSRSSALTALGPCPGCGVSGETGVTDPRPHVPLLCFY